MKDFVTAIKVTAFFVVVTGLAFPSLIWGVSQVLVPERANGSLLRRADGTIFGSALIGQQFSNPEYFHGRPSAAGGGYDAANSSGTNLGPTSAKLIGGINDDPATSGVDESFAGVSDLVEMYRKENNLPDSVPVPADAVTRSASGLDPHISIKNAMLQAARVAQARHTTVEFIEARIAARTEPRFLGIFGEPRVNVLLLNRDLDGSR